MIFNTVLISFSLDTLSVGDNKDKTNVPIPSLFHGAIRSVQSSSENYSTNCGRRSGLMVSALVPRASGLGSTLAGDTVLCSWARHSTLTVSLSTQEYKWVLANCWGNLTNCGEVTCYGLASCPGGVEILLAASCYRNRDKLQSYEPVLAPRLHFSFYKLK